MSIQVDDATKLLNTTRRDEIKVKSWTHLAEVQRLPILRAILKGEGIVKEQGSDQVEWGTGVRRIQNATFGQDYRGASRRSEPLPSIRERYFLPLQEQVCESYDVNELAAHMNTTHQKFCDYLGEQEDQVNEAIAIEQDAKLMYVPQVSGDKYNPQGLMWYGQPNRNAGGVIQDTLDGSGRRTGGYFGTRGMFQDGTTTTTRNNIDLSLEIHSKKRNYCRAIDGEINEDVVQAFEEASILMSWQMLPFTSQRFSKGNIRNETDTAMRPGLKMAKSTRLYVNKIDAMALRSYVEQVSPDDTGGDAVRFNAPKFLGFEYEWCPTIDPTSPVYLPGEGTVYPFRPMYLVNWAQWHLDMVGEFWNKTKWSPDPDNKDFKVSRSARAQYNLRPTDIRKAIATFYRMSA
jgi:hypothetical protein